MASKINEGEFSVIINTSARAILCTYFHTTTRNYFLLWPGYLNSYRFSSHWYLKIGRARWLLTRPSVRWGWRAPAVSTRISSAAYRAELGECTTAPRVGSKAREKKNGAQSKRSQYNYLSHVFLSCAFQTRSYITMKYYDNFFFASIKALRLERYTFCEATIDWKLIVYRQAPFRSFVVLIHGVWWPIVDHWRACNGRTLQLADGDSMI